jgi:hypothetical protein
MRPQAISLSLCRSGAELNIETLSSNSGEAGEGALNDADRKTETPFFPTRARDEHRREGSQLRVGVPLALRLWCEFKPLITEPLSLERSILTEGESLRGKPGHLTGASRAEKPGLQ